jgi:hypothetical protein
LWFHENLEKGRLEVKGVASYANLADILTKPLTWDTFERMRHLIMGW